MSKISKLIEAISALVKTPSLINNVINDNTIWQKKVTEQFDLNVGLPVIQLNDLFPNFSETLNSFSFLGGGSLPTDIALLKSAARKFDDCKYFEIGTWRGESVCNVADVAKECYTLNLDPNQLVQLTKNQKYADAHFFFSKDLPNVTQLLGDSRTFDYAGLNKKFDVIFIDGSHHYDFVKSDTQNVFQHLLHDNSIVIWHDYAYSPESIRFEVLKAILDGVPRSEHQNLYHVGNSMCAIFIKGKFPTSKLELYGQPKFTYEVNLKAKKL
jgi:predicted O-methyltransferase YrrM